VRVYMGFRLAGMCHVYLWDAEIPQRPVKLDMRLDLRNHSPDGPNWGYMGSGPAQLALALAADALNDDGRASHIYQHIKGPIQKDWGRDCWSMTDERLLEIIHAAEQAHPRPPAEQAEYDRDAKTGGKP
jgi:uncharacterized protein DUF6166